MKKIIMLSTLLALSACGGGSSETPETKTPETVIPDSVISGDTAFTDNGSNTLTGTVSLTENAIFIAQNNTKTPSGIFNISADGIWTFEPSRSISSFIELSAGQNITETINVQTSDGLTNTITITLVGINELPEFGTGDGVDSGEIDAESTVDLTGVLSISDDDVDESEFIEQVNSQGAFGAFSIAANGTWSYTMTNLASDFVSPEELFTVTSVDGTTHQVTILVKGLYQRLTSVKSIEGDIEYYEDGSAEYDMYGNERAFPIDINDLFDHAKIKSAQESTTTPIIYEYDAQGNLKKKQSYESESTTVPYQDYSYQYNYTDDELISFSYEELRYYFDEGNATLYRKYTNEYQALENQLTNSSYSYYKLDDEGENPEVSISITSEYTYNDIGKISEIQRRYVDTIYTDIEEAYEGQQLQYQFFYNDNGTLHSKNYYRNSGWRVFTGIATESNYNYTSQNRISFIEKKEATALENDDGVMVHGEFDTTSIYPYIYLDEIDVVLSFSIDDEYATVQEVDIFDAEIYQYEDIDQCSEALKILDNLKDTDLLYCKLKVESESTTKETLVESLE